MDLFKKAIVGILMMAGLFYFSSVLAADSLHPNSAQEMLQTTADAMIKDLAEGAKTNKQKDVNYVDDLVRKELKPHFDIESMARSVVGRDAWTKATEQQRQQFMQLFTDRVIRTYSNALTGYDGDKVEFPKTRSPQATSGRIQISSKIIRKNGQTIGVDYRLVLAGGEWKVYDFSVDNISMISSYRSQYADILGQHGLAGLITQLQSHQNKK